MARARIDDETGMSAVRASVATSTVAEAAADPIAASTRAPRETVATAVRYLLQLLAEKAPGHTLEVRVPPFGAVQCVEGPRHTRGTPPNVIETDAATWIDLASGRLSWDAAVAAARVTASGTRADLDGLIPVLSHSNRLG